MEGGGNHYNDQFGLFNITRPNVDNAFQQPQQTVQPNGVNMVNYQALVGWSYTLAAADGSSGSFFRHIEVGGPSWASGQHTASGGIVDRPPLGGTSIGGSLSVANHAGWSALNPDGVQASFTAQGDAGLWYPNSSHDVRRNISTTVTDPMAIAQARYQDAIQSLSQLQPVLPPNFHGSDNPYSVETPSESPSTTSSPTSTLPSRSNIWSYPPPPPPAAPLSRFGASNPRPGASNNFNLPTAQPQYYPLSSFVNPFGPHEFPNFDMMEVEEETLPDGMMSDESFGFFSDDIDENAPDGEGFVADPMMGGPMELSLYERMYQPVVLPPRNPRAALRARVISEVNIAFADAYRNGIVDAEDIQEIHESVLHQDVPEEQPDDGTVRINVGNYVSFEQLLQLREILGTISKELIEQTVLTYITPRKFQSLNLGPSTDIDESCCICQDEYTDGDDVTKLPCRHEYHHNCIMQWLVRKNVCPICKRCVVPPDYI